ncbi:MAG: glycosyltransferase, partial [Egibacteraceae bacterium]
MHRFGARAAVFARPNSPCQGRMSSSQTTHNVPRVAAILVVHDGVEWLNSVLATLAAQRYEALDLVVVDNASRDGSAEVLARRIPGERLITFRRNVGFARAVAAAVNHAIVAEADYLLLVHDDLVLAPDAVDLLVTAAEADLAVGVVGPKLREWSDDLVLTEVGMTIDRFGRADSRVEPDELDQGQHDRQDEVFYVSTAGMLLRRDLLRELGGFDARFPAFRDDLDLCWRAWLYGHRVEVVPDAVGYHIGAARGGHRFGVTRAVGARYLAERHALAAMLKHYGPARLAWVVPLGVVLAVARMAFYVTVRRFGDAGAVARASVWNLAQLPRTLRRRRVVQQRRSVADAELGHLFAKGLPGLRAYTGALGAWLAGGSVRALLDDEAAATEDRLADRPLVRFVRDHPAASTGLVLLIAYLAGLGTLLGSGQVVGGQIAPWPASTRDFLTAYASPFNGEPVGTIGFASPAQALLGALSFLGFGSRWLAQRLLVFGLVPVAWLLAMRAGRLLTPRAAPRALGATLYALSPVLLGALGRGFYGLLVGGTLLPGLVLLAVRAADRRIALDSAWRAAALLALGLVVAIASAPVLAPLLGFALLAGIVGLAAADARGNRPATARLG